MEKSFVLNGLFKLGTKVALGSLYAKNVPFSV